MAYKSKGRTAGIIALVLVLIIPTIVAIISYNIEKNRPISASNVSEMKLIDTEGEEFSFERSDKTLDKNDISSNFIAFFLEMNENSTEEASLPEPLQGTHYYKAVFNRYGKELTYRYYFSEPSSSYYLDDSGKCYHLPESYVSLFYLTKWAMPLFDGATPPVLSLPNGETVAASSVEWNYYVTDETLSTYNPGLLAGDTAKHNISESVTLNFSREPDFVSLAITDAASGSEIFSGLYDDIGLAVIEPNTDINITVSAEWHEQAEQKTPYGAATYNFTATYTDAPVFMLGQKKINSGEFTVVTIKNVVDPATIKFSSSPDIGFTPVFFKDGSCYRALVPISYELENADSGYTFTLSADGVTGTLILLVDQKSFAKKSTDIPASVANATRTDSTVSEFETNMAQVYATQNATKYFDGKFMDATGESGSDGLVRTGYGIYRSVTSQGVTYRHNGVDYATSKGDAVYAVNAGIVTYVGEQTLSGKTVVIDHGFGLMSTYAHLGDVSVNVGDTVITRQKIATAGDGGFTDGKNVHVAISVFDVPVSIYPLWDYGVVTE